MITIIHVFNTNMTEADKAQEAEAVRYVIETGQRIKARLSPKELTALGLKLKESQ